MPEKRLVLITGANQGVGFQVAKELVAAGDTVLLGSRNLERGVKAAAEIGPGAVAIQIDVTDEASIKAAAKRIESEYGHLDLLVNNAAISHNRTGEITLQEYVKTARASVIALDEVRAIWETNVFGVLAVYQAMLPLLRKSKNARVVNVSSGVGSLTMNSDKGWEYRSFYNPGYGASKTALNAISVAMMIDLEESGIKFNIVSPGFTSTALNNFEGTETLEEGSREVVRVCMLGPDGESGTYTMWEDATIPW